MEIHKFTLELPRETTPAEAHQAGWDYLHAQNPRRVIDFSCTGWARHKSKPDMAVFIYSYKA